MSEEITTAEVATISLYKAREKEFQLEIKHLLAEIEAVKKVNVLQEKIIQLLEEKVSIE